METVVKYLLLALALTSVQISYTESRLNEKRRERNERRYSSQLKDNICEVLDREARVHCYCENIDVNTATRADCWVFNGGIAEADPIWNSFSSQLYLERLTFNVRSDGALTFIPLHVIRPLKRLQKLHIHYATLNKIPKRTFSNMTSLREITLANNKINELDFSSFVNLPSLVNLTIKENKIYEIQRDVFVDLPSLRYLDLSMNGINLAHDGCFDHLSALNDLLLEGNAISVLTRDTFKGLANLTRLDLRSNKLDMIGDLTFSELWNLKELLLDNNLLRYVSERAFDGLALLQKLSMTGNQLTVLNEGLLEGVRGLELLDLRNNRLEHFTYETVKPIVENLKMKTSVLYLSGNKLICDCRLSWIHTLRNETKSEPLRMALDDVTCIPESEETNDDSNDINTQPPTMDFADNKEVFQQDGNDYDVINASKEPTVEPLTNQVAVLDIPPETLPCAKKLVNGEDSMMLSSNGDGFWSPNSSVNIMGNVILILFISLIIFMK